MAVGCRLQQQRRARSGRPGSREGAENSPRGNHGTQTARGQGQGQGQQGEANHQGGGGNATQGGHGGGQADEAVKLAEIYKDVWGSLPESLRAEMNAYSREQFMDKYRDQLKRYYSAIAEKGRKGE